MHCNTTIISLSSQTIKSGEIFYALLIMDWELSTGKEFRIRAQIEIQYWAYNHKWEYFQ